MDAVAIFYQQNLWRLVIYLKTVGNFIGNIAEANQIEVVGLQLRGSEIPFFFEAVLGHEAYTTTGTVFKNQAGNLVGAFNYLVEFVG